MYALDTNTLIFFFKGVGNVAQHLRTVPPSDIGIPSVVIHELEVGIAKSTQPAKRKAQLETLIDAVTILDLDIRGARAAAELRVRLEKAGLKIGPMDTLIAGTALAYRATLVTHNQTEFKRVAGLKLIDWY
jgi:tRNA(fMet)-specific endonuclease VapC